MARIFIAFIFGSILALSISLGVAAATTTTATTTADAISIIFPIPELGNCADQNACRAYCDNFMHKDECIAFARTHGLMSEEDAQRVENLPKVGPGGCTSEAVCKTYCADPANEAACAGFAEKHGIEIKKGTAVRARAKLIRENGGPGQCQSEKDCRAYCENPAHHGECLDFAEKHNLIEKSNIRTIKKVLENGGPGGCTSEEACKAYCADPAHVEECLAFAEQNGLINKDEAERAKKLAGKLGPGGCQGEQCKIYCEDPAHQEECIAFAQEHGFISKDEATTMEHGRAFAQKIKEAGGPGGCTSESACKTYCADPAHVEECLAFAVEHGGMHKDDAEGKLREFIHAVAEHLPMIGRQGTTTDERFKIMEEELLQKFEHFRELEGQFRKPETMMQGGTFSGPGGCQGPEECIQYCAKSEHRDECAKLNPRAGGVPSGELFRQAESGAATGYERKLEDMRQCGPRPAMPTPAGCTGPICKDGRWNFSCENFGSSSTRTTPLFRAQEGSTSGGGTSEGSATCTKEFRPVCGANNRTYPNSCYAERDGTAIAKEGACQAGQIERQEGVNTQLMTPEAIQQFNMQQSAGFTQPYPAFQGAPMPLEQQLPPQSRGIPDIFFANILNGFSGIFRLR